MSDDEDSVRQEREELVAGESEVLHDLRKGALAGLFATIPVALLAVANQSLGLTPELDLVGILTRLSGIAWGGMGWILLFVAGAVLGMGFASLDSHVSDTTIAGELTRGAFFGFLLSVIMMIILMPIYGGGLAVAGSLILTGVIFGMVMGVVYEKMKPEHVA